VLDLLAAYAVPALAAAAVGVATGWFGGRGLAWAWSLAAALALACGAIALHDSLAAPGRVGLWTESALILAAAYAAAYAVGAGVRLALHLSSEATRRRA
jgi:hypothetical protein